MFISAGTGLFVLKNVWHYLQNLYSFFSSLLNYEPQYTHLEGSNPSGIMNLDATEPNAA